MRECDPGPPTAEPPACGGPPSGDFLRPLIRTRSGEGRTGRKTWARCLGQMAHREQMPGTKTALLAGSQSAAVVPFKEQALSGVETRAGGGRREASHQATEPPSHRARSRRGPRLLLRSRHFKTLWQNRPVARRGHSRSHGDAVATRRQDTVAVRRRRPWVPKCPPLPAGAGPRPPSPGHAQSLPRNLLLPVSGTDRPCQLPGTPFPTLHTGAPAPSRHELPREASDLAPPSGVKSGHAQPSPVGD